MTERASLLEFPCDFPLKVMGAAVDGFAQTIATVVLQHAPDFDPATIEMRPSRAGNYLSLTCTIRATSQIQLDDLYRVLSSHPMVKVAL
jgi:putative lipoic acid-binding regulatory protein